MKEIKEKSFHPFGIDFTKSVLEPSNRDKKILFWFLSLLIVPIFAQIYALMMFLVVWLLFTLLHKDIPDVFGITLFLIAVVFAIGTYFMLWKSFKKNYLKEKVPNQAL